MKTQRHTLVMGIAIALTAINLALLILLLSQGAPEGEGPILRGRALELVDEHGQIRARINVEPEGEVVLRLLDQQGTIRVKLGASKDGSGLVLLNDATEPGVQILAEAAGSSLKLRNGDGLERIITPQQ